MFLVSIQTNIMEKKIDIFCTAQNKKFLSLINKKFNSKIVKQKGTNFYKLSLIVNNFTINKFYSVFSSSVIEYFKFNYLNNNIMLTELNPELRLALVKALTKFDADLDKQVIESKLTKIDNVIYVESFLAFFVPEFEMRLNELCALANNNKEKFVMSETFNELFKFILTNLNFNGSEVILCKKGKVIVIYNVKGREIYTATCADGIELTLKLVELLPKKIIIKLPKEECKALNFVCKIFDNLIEFKN